MTAQRDPKRKSLVVKIGEEDALPNENRNVTAKTSQTHNNIKAKAKAESNVALTNAARRKKVIQSTAELEGKARIKPEDLPAKAMGEELPFHLETERPIFVRRFSFFVRLTIDEYNQVRRTEIKHVESDREQNFPILNGDLLISFIKDSINPIREPEHITPPVPSSNKISSSTSDPDRTEPRLLISDVQVFRSEALHFLTFTHGSGQPFIVRVRFQLLGSENRSMDDEDCLYEFKVYANEVKSGESKLLTISRANLIKDVPEYTATISASGLSPGIYRLFTHITLGRSGKLTCYREGPIIRIT